MTRRSTRNPNQETLSGPTDGQDRVGVPNGTAPAAASQDVVGAPVGLGSLVRDPGHLPGTRRQRFAPIELYAENHDIRGDVDPFDDALWLTEEPLRRIDKNGIELGGEFYAHERLQYLVTGPAGTPKPDLYIRYNRAALSRGVLDEVRVYLKDPKEGYIEQCRCPRRSEWLATADTTMVLHHRERYLRRLLAMTKLSHGELLAVRSGTTALETLRDQERARAQAHKGFKAAPMVAGPRFAGQGAEERETRANTRITTLAEGVSAVTGDHAPAADERVDAGTSAGGVAGSVPAPARSSRTPRSRPKRSPSKGRAPEPSVSDAPTSGTPAAGPVHPPEALADEFGGRTGFAKKRPPRRRD